MYKKLLRSLSVDGVGDKVYAGGLWTGETSLSEAVRMLGGTGLVGEMQSRVRERERVIDILVNKPWVND